ncbi:MAG: hypothetical protein COW00_09230 [Bdellovibrio sp. CG12_big_fil_rev_8_21_14_0_65_39_13]|nr:MAG: hypothetical protein COW78_09300 [Bdellovibrio sp. CG22_combo_CG10-13_8_21_14_all_39_27]PIQ59804.1 MAG: hypothetical protein COW00_09230 [Bdellovibrio sp. CG12_big_fil_rev_8_21_14_0_65_39_13]PIR36168.1 MAG: hypothetical protein COV37_04160 [Bdellovibrio sp. CG11_big_fil_rev_8_21_14_0_20_39_38]PJB52774.1 MAG: hypothetical protein CO099_10790 [Bdellovibrio sp. CG_4_9_14_3_um_filter_39_7]
MKLLIISLIVFFQLTSCKEEQKPIVEAPVSSAQASSQDFSDLKPKDESCDSEEELKKKLEEELKNNAAKPSLTGFKDADCEVK